MAGKLRILILAAAVACLAACGETPNQLPAALTPSRPPLPTASPVGLQTPNPGSIYLGAYVPDGKSILSLEAATGRRYAIDADYQKWVSRIPSAQANNDLSVGRIYLVSWACGVSDASIANGSADMLIATVAQSIQRYGHTVFLRFMWDPNMPSTYLSRTGCWDGLTDNADGTFSAAQYVAAWRHIHKIFSDNGANNVDWVWSFNAAGSDPAPYYPGDDQVDWVGIDSYANPYSGFAQTFSSAYASAVQHNKPIIVTETGALSANQSDFFVGAAATLQSSFPSIKAFVYYDAADGSGHNWSLGTAGLTMFTVFSNDLYMSALPVSI